MVEVGAGQATWQCATHQSGGPVRWHLHTHRGEGPGSSAASASSIATLDRARLQCTGGTGTHDTPPCSGRRRERTSVGVDLLGVDAQRLHAVGKLAGKGLVDLQREAGRGWIGRVTAHGRHRGGRCPHCLCITHPAACNLHMRAEQWPERAARCPHHPWHTAAPLKGMHPANSRIRVPAHLKHLHIVLGQPSLLQRLGDGLSLQPTEEGWQARPSLSQYAEWARHMRKPGAAQARPVGSALAQLHACPANQQVHRCNYQQASTLTGPMPMTDGCTPTAAKERRVAIMGRPRFSAWSRDISITQAAPSVVCSGREWR